MKIVKLITCDSATQAHIVQGALQNEGIDSMLRNENMSTLLAGLQVGDLTGVDILVGEKDYEAAISLLEQNQMIPEQLKYCPFCGSPDIKFVLRKRASDEGCCRGYCLFVGQCRSGHQPLGVCL